MVDFEGICPVCKGPMAEKNKYCCMDCYYKGNPEQAPNWWKNEQEETVL